MKHFTIVNRDDKQSLKIAKQIHDQLIAGGGIYDISNPEIVLCVGGDGTILHGVHQWMSKAEDVCFIGVHTGTLGFYTDYLSEEIDSIVHSILHEQPQIETKKLLHATITNNFTTKTFYGLNEIRIESIIKTQQIDVYLNGAFFETTTGNGVCVSGQYGSTAYNRSADGAILWEGLNLLQLIELTSIHHKRARSLRNPLILPEDTLLRFDSTDHFEQAVLIYDHLSYPLSGVNSIEVKVNKKAIRFAHYKQSDFAQRLRTLF